MDIETVIGLEVHVQLSTKSKIFSASSSTFGAEPNTHVDPVTFGLPGCLPVLNRQVVEFAMMLGLALSCQIRKFNRFARKHYFYPDLPKGYQISQFEQPICERGNITIIDNEKTRSIGITRIHMEEDAGKNIHDSQAGASLIDLNRAGTPLLEIVTEPDLRSPAEAAAFLKTLRQIVRYLAISDGNMEQGSLRCDANISIRPSGQLHFGTRTEIKNLNSFKFVEKALEYEAARQVKALKHGQEIIQETRLFDSSSGVTKSMRGKEGSADYRYFPDPDLPPLVIEESWIRDVKSRMPKLPGERFQELVEAYGLSEYDAAVLTTEKHIVEYFEQVYVTCQNPKAACNWLTSELFGVLNREGLDLQDSPITAENLGKLIKLIDTDVISGKMAKAVFEEMYRSGANPEQIVEEKGLKQITSEKEILAVVEEVLQKHPKQVQDFHDGNEKVVGFFVGQVMKATKGNSNPKLVNKVIRKQLKKT